MTIKEYALINREKPFKANSFTFTPLRGGHNFVKAIKLYSKNMTSIPKDKKEFL